MWTTFWSPLSQNDYLLVVNAGTKDKDYAGFAARGRMAGIHISDYSDYYSQLAVQGRARCKPCKADESRFACDQELLVHLGEVAGWPMC